jgi:hypothetical protein
MPIIENFNLAIIGLALTSSVANATPQPQFLPKWLLQQWCLLRP